MADEGEERFEREREHEHEHEHDLDLDLDLEHEHDRDSSTWGSPPAEHNPRHDVSPPSSPSFAPVGRPVVRKRFRSNIPNPLRLDIPHGARLSSLHNSYSNAVVTRMDRVDNVKFIEQFRYTIVASQLLSGQSLSGQHQYHNRSKEPPNATPNAVVPTSTGLIATAAGALIVAWMISWVYSGGIAYLTKKRMLFATTVLIVGALFSHAYIRKQWLRYVRDQALSEVATFVSGSQDFDSASSAALSLIQEVELVSRGYRISAPLPPISRIEDRSQTRRCLRLRKALRARLADMIQNYTQVSSVFKGFSEQLDLDKFYDIYDISDFDMSDALQGFSESEFEDSESLRVLKIAAARFHTIRKILLCALLAFEASGDNTDFLRWSTAVEGLRTLNEVTKDCFERLRHILSEEETFPTFPEPKMPLTPGRERRRSQFRKLNSLSTGIRGLQARLALLREESERSLNEADDVSELGSSLLAQYDSIGQDLRTLTQAWEEGKAALASGIDRNEKRLSSMSLFSPTSSLSGLTTVEEGGTMDAFKALTGESPPSSNFGSTGGDIDEAEVFEAVALPRPRSTLSREERLMKMKEDREKREIAREKSDANHGMLRELEMVINLRPKRSNTAAARPSHGRFSI
ncbi:Mysoin-binding motif of peroxisomes-domain-containing protein [Lasiosphaeria ovina]|uniref:Vezatin n=1 Tax=Lasiosphaeria ovina TaxID=92902 RepID=A0AAE0NLG8_9PEZI|nr:Mysoin-binding motif of peroxisomes-domain-containing protein [Lasiosphaeria ovina]